MRDLGFAFNDKDFSDRILLLELVQDSIDSDSIDSITEECDSARSNKKQKTEHTTETGDAACEETSKPSSTDVVKVRSLHIISAVLASCSPYFLKLFKNGMKESQEKSVTLRINASEEVAFMDLLNFMYTNTLTARRVTELLDVLMVADKFEASSCMSYCSKELEDRTIYLDNALLYVEIPSRLSACQVVQSVIDAAKDYLRKHYADFIGRGRQEEMMEWPLSALEAVLNGEIQVRSEEDVYDFILTWGRARYPKQKERQEVLTRLIERYIHFPYLAMSTLKKIQECPDFDSNQVSDLILESLYLNSGHLYGECYRLPNAIDQKFIRNYDYLPIKETQFGSCHVFYLNLEKKLFADLQNKNRYSREFSLGGQSFRFWVCVRGDDNYLGLFLERREDNKESCTFGYELEVQKSAELAVVDYESIYKFENCCLSLGKGKYVGSSDLFGYPLKEFLKMGKYFSDEMLHLRAKFTIKN